MSWNAKRASDMPKFANNYSQDILTKRGFPDFESHLGVGLEMEASYPVGRGSFISVGGRIYMLADPNPWTFWLGYSISLEKIQSVTTFFPGAK